jgi:hypothetical protein
MPIQSGNQLLDYNLVYAWNVQNTEPSGEQASPGAGVTGPGYAQAGVTPVSTNTGSASAGQAGSGTAMSAIGSAYQSDLPAGATADGSAPVLYNPGYSGEGTFLGQLSATTTPAAPALSYAARINNPSGLAAQVTFLTAASVTGVYVGPNGVGGSGTTNLTEVSAGGAAEFTVAVPPAGVIYVTGSGASWVWMTQN